MPAIKPRRITCCVGAFYVAALHLFSLETHALDFADIVAGKGGFVIEGHAEGGASGRGVDGIGDVNGDGFDDIAIILEPNTGDGNVCHVVFGRSDTAPVSLSDVDNGVGGFTIEGTPDVDSPTTISSLGDVNADNLSDFAIGLPRDSGTVVVVFGKSDTTPVLMSDLAAGNGGYAINNITQPGGSVSPIISPAGDVNGDGIPDLFINHAPACVVFSKSDTAPINIANVVSGIGGFSITNTDGTSGTGAGDVNGDGFDDIIVNALLPGATGVVLFGKANTAPINAAAVGNGTAGFRITYSIFGTAAGDVNDDGLDDLLVRRNLVENEDLFVVFGKQTQSALTLNTIAQGVGGFRIRSDLGAYLTNHFAAGDFNQDGKSDIAFGFGSEFTPDALGVVYGKSTGTTVTWSALRAGSGGFTMNRIASYNSSYSACSGGDVNNDGIPDMLVGGQAFVGGVPETAAFFVVFGGHPSFPDADDDGLSDSAESNTSVLRRPWDTGTDPNVADTDHDGVSDGGELEFGTDPNNWRVAPTNGPLPHIVTEAAVMSTARGFPMHGMVVNDATAARVAAAGDVNGDGYDDVMVSAPGADPGGRTNAGRVFIVFGSSTPEPINLSNIAAGIGGFVITGREEDSRIGSGGMFPAGDANGDGLDDLVVVAYHNWQQNVEGNVFVVFGKTDTAPINLNAIWNGNGGGYVTYFPTGTYVDSINQARFSPNAIRDINGDGLDDIVVPIQSWSGEGLVHCAVVIFGKTDVSPIAFESIVAGSGGFVIDEDIDTSDGRSTISAGDVNGDGLCDIYLDGGTTAYVIFGKPDTAAVQLADIAQGTGGFPIIDTSTARVAVGGTEDVNGDGLSDLLFSSGWANQDYAENAGQSYVVFGQSGTTPIDIADVALGIGGFIVKGSTEAPAGLINIGHIAGAGDLNGDGLGDFLVGGHSRLPIPPTNNSDALAAPKMFYAVYGKTDTDPVELFSVLHGTGGFFVAGWPGRTAFGASLSAAGDVNGDGFGDIIAGAPNDILVNNALGHAYVIFGFDPPLPDVDADLIPDYAETGTGIFIDNEDTGTNLNDPDSDNDGILDGTEIDLGTDPNDPDDFPVLSLHLLTPFLAAFLIGAAVLIKRRLPAAPNTRRR